MQNSKLKNSIVLRGMASNVVDEAIVILKPNIKIKNMQLAKKKNQNSKSCEKNLIVKEAENVINEYVSRLNETPSKISKLENKVKILRMVNFIFFVILIICVAIGLG